MGRIIAPIQWLGGKYRMAPKIVKFIEERPHKIYVEPFGGGASVLLAKTPSQLEVYNDIDGGLVNFFKVLANSKLFESFLRIVSVLPHSRSLYNEYKRTWINEDDPVKKAAKWFVIARQSFSGNFDNWGYSIKSPVAKRWLNCINGLPEVHYRLQNAIIECSDWSNIIKNFDSVDTLFYVDPPYLKSTRTKHRCYRYDLTDDDHIRLIEILLTLKGQVILSGYKNEIYKPLIDNGWCYQEFTSICQAAKRTKNVNLNHGRIECIWATPIIKDSIETDIKIF